jgi:DNA ligase D-like protein (predicted polymerase)
LVWSINLGCIGIDPWPIRKQDVEHPDELRFDLDPTPGIKWADVRQTAHMVREVLQEHKLEGFPKTSGKRGMHIVVRIKPEEGNGFKEVRRAGIVVAREVERRLPGIATTAWWKEERRGVFVDYNQNARDHTIASAYSVRGNPEATVSTPIRWDEIDSVVPLDFTIATVPARFAELGDLHAGIDDAVFGLEALLEWAERDEVEGLAAPPEGTDESS